MHRISERMIIIKGFFCLLMSIGFIVLSMCGVNAGDRFYLNLESVKGEYILREPVKFIVKFINESDRTIRIYRIDRFNENMEQMYLEVITPKGEIQLRKSTIALVNRISSVHYGGDPIEPGESIEVFLYPNETHFIQSPRSWGFTFPEAGTYRLRVVYTVEEFRERLWKPENNKMYSNSIDITFREPTPEEKEILDAFWDGMSYLFVWDEMPMAGFNVDRLKEVMAKYPNNHLMKYVYFAMGHELRCPPIGPSDSYDIDKAIEYFEMLKDRHPDFRFEETRQYLARFYMDAGRREEAIRLNNETLRERPNLKDHYRFMRQKILAEEQDNMKAVTKWIRKRSRGEIREEEKPKDKK